MPASSLSTTSASTRRRCGGQFFYWRVQQVLQVLLVRGEKWRQTLLVLQVLQVQGVRGALNSYLDIGFQRVLV